MILYYSNKRRTIGLGRCNDESVFFSIQNLYLHRCNMFSSLREEVIDLFSLPYWPFYNPYIRRLLQKQQIRHLSRAGSCISQ